MTNDARKNNDSNRIVGCFFIGLFLLNLPVGLWLLFLAPKVPSDMRMADLDSAPFGLQVAYFLGGGFSISAICAVSTAIFLIGLALIKVSNALRKT